MQKKLLDSPNLHLQKETLDTENLSNHTRSTASNSQFSFDISELSIFGINHNVFQNQNQNENQQILSIYLYIGTFFCFGLVCIFAILIILIYENSEHL